VDRPPATGHRSPATGHRPLATGHRPLATGHPDGGPPPGRSPVTALKRSTRRVDEPAEQ